MPKTIRFLELTHHPNVPERVVICKSNWYDYYHVITEDPTEGDLWHEHKFLTLKEVIEKYDLEQDYLNIEPLK